MKKKIHVLITWALAMIFGISAYGTTVIVYENDWDNPPYTGWEFSADNWQYHTSGATGAKTLRLLGTAQIAGYLDQVITGDFTLSMDVQPEWQNHQGIIFGQDFTNFYFVEIRPTTRPLRVKQATGDLSNVGGLPVLAEAPYEFAEFGVYRIDIVVKDKKLTVSVDGQILVQDVDIPDWESGKVGIFANGSQVRYDNMLLTQTADVVTYSLTVNNGTGDGNYEEDEVVSITADAPPAGQRFAHWTGDVANVANVKASATTITMPAENVVLTAEYEVIPVAYDGKYENDWDNPPYTGWEFSNTNWQYHTSGATGAKTLRLMDDGQIAGYLDRAVAGDFTLSIDVQPEWANHQGIIFGQDFANFYFVEIRPGNRPLRIKQAMGDLSNVGGLPSLAEGPFSFVEFEVYRIDIVVKDKKLTVSVDGQILVQDVAVTDWDSGKVGVFANGSRVRYDNMVLDYTGEGYTLDVTNGSGSGTYAKGSEVEIVADAPAAGQQFVKWTGDIAHVANVNASSTTVAIPADHITVTAEYKDISGSYQYTPFEQVVYDHVGEPFRTGTFTAPWGAHEGLLHGVPLTYNWAQGARPSLWSRLQDYEAVSSWGQAYEWAEKSPETNVRIHIRNHKLYAFTDGNWELLESASDDIAISEYAEDFTSSFGSPPFRVEPEGGISAKMTSGRNLHWWPNTWPRPSVPENYEAFFVTCEIRIIHNNNPDVDLYQARYLAGASSDGYPTTTSGGLGPWPSLSINRHKFITPQWQTITSYITSFIPTTVEDYENDILSRALPPGVAQPGTPTVKIVDPISNTDFVLPEAVEITAVAQDSDGTIDKVEFFIDNQLAGTISESPYVFSFANPQVGTYQVHARVFDNDGNEGISYPVFFTVLPSKPPVISITSPTNGQVFVQETTSILFSVDASDEDGTIASVVYYLNGQEIAELNTEPFEFEWTTLSIGNFVLQAKATDDTGVSKMSDPVTFTVQTGFSYFNDFTVSDFTGWNFVNGTWRYSASQAALYNSTGNDIEIAVYEPVELYNYYFSADVKPEWKNWSGLLFNYQDSVNYYIVELAINNPPLGASIIKMENGEPTELYTSTYTDGGEGVFSNIEILNNDGFTTVRVNGKLIFDNVETPDFLQGKVGLYSRWTPTTFDNIQIIGSVYTVLDPMGNLVSNPGFEKGFEGWTQTTGTTEVILDENDLINGTNILKLGPAGWSTALQQLPVQAETTYVLSATGLVDTEERFVRIQLKDAGITMLESRFDINTTTSTRLWKKFTTKADISEDVIVEIYTRENGDYLAYVDNVVLRVYQLPTCSIDTENTEISLDQGQVLNLDVLAHSEVLEIKKVELYVNGTTLIATVNEEPWSFSVSDLPSGVHTIHAVAYDQSDETAQSQTITVTVSGTVSVDEITHAAVKVFPNPARNVVFVQSKTENSQLVIINSMGQVVIEKKLSGLNNEINISHLPNGMYFVKVTGNYDDNLNHTIKIIKK